MSAELTRIANDLVAPGKGILAADESSGTIKKRFDSIKTEPTDDNIRAYRELLITTPEMENSISGVILFDETTRQSTSDGTPFVDLLARKGVHPGVKTDQGLQSFGNYGEQSTKGLDDLLARSQEYAKGGLVFAKARSVFSITDNTPTDELIRENAEFQAMYASISQAAGLVPIVEPEVLIDGAHSIEVASLVTEKVLREVFVELDTLGVDLSGILLKPNMVTPGKSSNETVTDEEIARATIEVLLKTVPPDVQGIVFLSGGQTPSEASRRLATMNRLYRSEVPWELSFSFGRALQENALKAWGGEANNIGAAQAEFLKWAKINSMARSGR